MKITYDKDQVTEQDYLDVGLTNKGIKRALKVEALLVEAFNTILENEENVSPHDVTGFMKRCVESVGLNRTTVTAWNKRKSK